MAQTKNKITKRNALHCEKCAECGRWADHKTTDKCYSFCAHCHLFGHNMSHCYKLKFCNLCGKAGHNPYRCWQYSTIQKWIVRAKVLDRCVSCLTPWKFSTFKFEKVIPCNHCGEGFKYIDTKQSTESQTDDIHIDQESQIELQQGKATIENQKIDIEEMKSKILSLENKLESSNATIDSLEWKLKSITKEKEQELQNVIKLDALCKEKEIELRKLQELISQKDIELEKHRGTSAQPSQTIPAKAQQPCSNPIPTVNQLEHMRETNYMKGMLTDLQNQQEKLFVIVNLLYNKTKAQDMSRPNYPSFNPYMGLYDTGQYFNKLQQV